MAQPRFLFVVRTPTEEEGAAEQAGRATGGSTLGSHGTGGSRGTGLPQTAPERPVVWRLVGANNRELGRSAGVSPGLAACREAVVALREGIEHAVSSATVSNVTGMWSWRMEIDGQAVAVSGREYRRQRECHYNLANFLAAVPVAHLPLKPVLRQRLRGLLDDHGPRGPWPHGGGHQRWTSMAHASVGTL